MTCALAVRAAASSHAELPRILVIARLLRSLVAVGARCRADNTCHFGLNNFFADNGLEDGHVSTPLLSNPERIVIVHCDAFQVVTLSAPPSPAYQPPPPRLQLPSRTCLTFPFSCMRTDLHML